MRDPESIQAVLNPILVSCAHANASDDVLHRQQLKYVRDFLRSCGKSIIALEGFVYECMNGVREMINGRKREKKVQRRYIINNLFSSCFLLADYNMHARSGRRAINF
jgi:hypothetical protein